ncbi:hypothetical protein LTR85_009000 [Meristemomyces frigidus]|nr:hypothetical protein LTR85_009000 [Meristemomyces frigidus]
MAETRMYEELSNSDLKELLKQRNVRGRGRMQSKRAMVDALQAYDDRYDTTPRGAATATPGRFGGKGKTGSAPLCAAPAPVLPAAAAPGILPSPVTSMPQASVPQNMNQGSGLLRLPVELRARIYKSVFAGSRSTTSPTAAGSVITAKSFHSFGCTIYRLPEPALCRASREIRTEAIPVFYGKAPISLKTGGASELQAWFEGTGIAGLPLLWHARNLTIEVPMPYKHRCRPLLEECAKAKTVGGTLLYIVKDGIYGSDVYVEGEGLQLH